MDYIYLPFPKSVTSASFINNVMSKVPVLPPVGAIKEIIFDFTNTEKIYGDSLTKIIALSLYLKNELNVRPYFYIPWNPTLLGELDDMGFLRWLDESEEFNWSSENKGGYSAPRGKLAELSSPML